MINDAFTFAASVPPGAVPSTAKLVAMLVSWLNANLQKPGTEVMILHKNSFAEQIWRQNGVFFVT
jgi:hypothetical protein